MRLQQLPDSAAVSDLVGAVLRAYKNMGFLRPTQTYRLSIQVQGLGNIFGILFAHVVAYFGTHDFAKERQDGRRSSPAYHLPGSVTSWPHVSWELGMKPSIPSLSEVNQG